MRAPSNWTPLLARLRQGWHHQMSHWGAYLVPRLLAGLPIMKGHSRAFDSSQYGLSNASDLRQLPENGQWQNFNRMSNIQSLMDKSNCKGMAQWVKDKGFGSHQRHAKAKYLILIDLLHQPLCITGNWLKKMQRFIADAVQFIETTVNCVGNLNINGRESPGKNGVSKETFIV